MGKSFVIVVIKFLSRPRSCVKIRSRMIFLVVSRLANMGISSTKATPPTSYLCLATCFLIHDWTLSGVACLLFCFSTRQFLAVSAYMSISACSNKNRICSQWNPDYNCFGHIRIRNENSLQLCGGNSQPVDLDELLEIIRVSFRNISNIHTYLLPIHDPEPSILIAKSNIF